MPHDSAPKNTEFTFSPPKQLIIGIIIVIAIILLDGISSFMIPPSSMSRKLNTSFDIVLLLGLLGGLFYLLRYVVAPSRRVFAKWRESQQQYRQLLDGSNYPIMMFALEADGNVGKLLEANTAATEQLGYAEADLRERSLGNLLLPERQQDVVVMLEELRSRQQNTIETIVISRDGRRIPVEWCARREEYQGVTRLRCSFRDISDPKRVEESLREARANFRTLQTITPLAVVILDPDGKVTNWNRAAEEIFGWKEYEIFQHPLPIIPKEGEADFQELLQRVQQKERVQQVTLPAMNHDGKRLDVQLSAMRVLDGVGNLTGIMLVFADVTATHELAITTQRLERATSFITEVKRAMFRAVDEMSLLRGVCHAMVQVGGYRLAWVGLVGEDPLKTVQPLAWEGEDGAYLESTHIPTGSAASGRDPVVAALRTGAAARAAQLLVEGSQIPWVHHALTHGTGSLVALPLMAGWRPFGVLVVCASAPAPIADAEIDLLAEFADDLAYGIEMQRVRVEHQRAQEGLADAARQWHGTFDALADPISILDAGHHVARCNQAMARLLGKEPQAVLGKPVCELLHDSALPPVPCLLSRVAETRERATETISRGERWFTTTVEPIFDADGNPHGVVHIMRDITERKQADEELRHNFARMQNIVDETITAIAKIAEMRDPYTAGHEQRVSDLSCAIAREMGWSDDRIKGLQVAGMLHDIGKLFVPAEILSKSGPLSKAEFDVIKAHPQAGFDILKNIDFPWPIAQMVIQHHERLNGSGYPNAVPGEDILPEARILAVADVVESMASHRPYRPARGLDAALGEVTQRAGDAYDQDVVTACLRLFRERNYVLPPQS